MKGPLEEASTREYPHLVRRSGRHLYRGNLVISNEPVPFAATNTPTTFIGLGMIDSKDQLTPAGRRRILERMAAEARGKNIPQCIVWGPKDCTWLSPTGETRDGKNPPVAEMTNDTFMYDRMPVQAETCWTIELPKGHEPTHLCIIPIDARRVEVAAGEQICLGLFDEPAREGERNPAEALCNPKGEFDPPAHYRGQPVTEVDDWLVLGPVQPFGQGVVLRDAWPHEIKAACEKIAGIPLSDEIMDRVWRAVHPDNLDFTPVGVPKAA